MAIIEIIQTASMAIATILYASKNIKHLKLCFGFIQCVQKSDQDKQIEELQNELEEAIQQLKSVRDKLNDTSPRTKA